MPFGVGPAEMIIVLIVVLLVMGPKRLPGVGRQLGTGMREFKEAVTGESRAEDDVVAALDPVVEREVR